jgi:hypothetical protein
MERVAFLLHGTFEGKAPQGPCKGKKTIDIFVCGKAAMSEEEKEALVRQVEDSNGQRFRTHHKTRR